MCQFLGHPVYDKECLIYSNQISLRLFLRNELHIEYVTCDKLKDIFNLYIYGVACTDKLAKRSIKSRPDRLCGVLLGLCSRDHGVPE